MVNVVGSWNTGFSVSTQLCIADATATPVKRYMNFFIVAVIVLND
jgi:hypothetical protein